MQELLTYLFQDAETLTPLGLMSFFTFVMILDFIGTLLASLIDVARGK